MLPTVSNPMLATTVHRDTLHRPVTQAIPKKSVGSVFPSF